jgi:hypothetical protein
MTDDPNLSFTGAAWLDAQRRTENDLNAWRTSVATTAATGGAQRPLKAEDLKNLVKDLEAQFPPAEWILAGPNGKVWKSANPRELLVVLARQMYATDSTFELRPHLS